MNGKLKGMALALVLLATALQAGAEWHVWVAPARDRVLRDAPPGTQRTISLALARNETRSFQILMRADEPVKGITLKPGRFGEGTKEVPSARLFREHQLQITTPSLCNTNFKPGWYPDPLIPFINPQTGSALQGGKYLAQPFDLPANETHGFWVDVHVPAGAPVGDCQAIFTLTAAQPGQTIEIPVRLTVWNFALPATPAMQTSFGSPAERIKSYYAKLDREGKAKYVTNLAALDTQCARMLAEHRVNATPPAEFLHPEKQADGGYLIPDTQIKALATFVDHYHINALEIPRAGLFEAVKDPEAERDKLHAWLKAYDQATAKLNRPNLTFYLYLTDEPNDKEAYDFIRKWGKPIRQAGSVVKVMVTEQTQPEKPEWGDLYGAVDIWCPLFPIFDPENAAVRQKLGETVWAYTALCQRKPPTPFWQTDYPLLNYRVPAWIAWRYQIKGLLYWGGMCFWQEAGDPWTNPWTYGHKNKNVFNGEGVLVYPGRAVGFEGIVPSIRLKALRDGIEDYDYLALAERLGRGAEASKIVRPLAESWFNWNADPAAYDRARAQLAELILAAGGQEKK